MLIRFQDNTWQREFTGVRADLHAIASDAGGMIFVAGSNGTVLAQRQQHWVQEKTGVTATLQALLCSGGEVYAAGAGGVLLRRT